MADQLAHEAAQKVARSSYGRLIAYLAKHTRDVAGAEDALSEAFAAALADWPRKGIPANPEAWLMAVAKRKTIDAARRTQSGAAAADHLQLLADEIESMADQLGAQDVNWANASSVANGYYAVCSTYDQGAADPCNGANLTTDANWQPGVTSRLATNLPGVNAGVDPYGNTIQYIVERMCNLAGTANSANCLLASVNSDNNTKNVQNEPLVGAPEVLGDVPVYRVTVRIQGPKNVVSYIQAFIS